MRRHIGARVAACGLHQREQARGCIAIAGQDAGARRFNCSEPNLKQASCPVARTLNFVGESWPRLILRDAFAGIGRFSEFEASLGMSKNLLTARLRKLVEHGILAPAPAPVAGSGAHQQYQLSKTGRSLL